MALANVGEAAHFENLENLKVVVWCRPWQTLMDTGKCAVTPQLGESPSDTDTVSLFGSFSVFMLSNVYLMRIKAL